jgi:hypothetical protein
MDENLHVEEMMRELSQLMKSWKLKFHHGWNIKEKSCNIYIYIYIQIKLMNEKPGKKDEKMKK